MDLCFFHSSCQWNLPPDSCSRHLKWVCWRHDEWMEWIRALGMYFVALCFVLSCNCCILLLKLLALPAFASDRIPLCFGLWGQTLPPWWGAKTLVSEAAHACTPSHGGPQRERGGAAFYLPLKRILPPICVCSKTSGCNCVSSSGEPGRIPQRC